MKQLETTTAALIRFGDLDPMGIVWHGNYYLSLPPQQVVLTILKSLLLL